MQWFNLQLFQAIPFLQVLKIGNKSKSSTFQDITSNHSRLILDILQKIRKLITK